MKPFRVRNVSSFAAGSALTYNCRIMNVIAPRLRLSRRSLLAGAAVMLAAPPALGSTLKLNDDGLYTKPWFLESLLDLNDDLKEAADKGKRLVIMWELKGCPYCKKIHEINLADPAIETFIKDKFEVLQLNIRGSREVTDFDGERLPEKDFARKYGVRATPTFQFFPESADGPCAEAASSTRGGTLAGLYGAEAVHGDVPVRGRQGLRQDDPAGLSEGE